MKKSIIGMLAITAVAAVNAATLNWSVTGAQANGSGSALKGTPVALILATTATSASDITYSYSGSNWTIGGGVLANVGTLNDSSKLGATAMSVSAWGGTASGKDFNGNDITSAAPGTGSAGAVQYYAIVFDTDYKSGKYTVLAPVANTKATSSTANSANVIFSAAAGANSTWSNVNVPEPTTVALLALGLAAVSLKRKVA